MNKYNYNKYFHNILQNTSTITNYYIIIYNIIINTITNINFL